MFSKPSNGDAVSFREVGPIGNQDETSDLPLNLVKESRNKEMANAFEMVLQETNPLHILASVALELDEYRKLVNPNPKNPEPVKNEVWFTLGVVKGSNVDGLKYLLMENNYSNVTIDNFQSMVKSNTTQKFRVAAIDSYGVGTWAEVSTFTSNLPEFPGTPRAVKIYSTREGCNVSWERLMNGKDQFCYSVFLAVREDNEAVLKVNFLCVYCGTKNSCVVPRSKFARAHFDITTKAATFKVVAQNDKGYGPPVEMKWVPDAFKKRMMLLEREEPIPSPRSEVPKTDPPSRCARNFNGKFVQ